MPVPENWRTNCAIPFGHVNLIPMNPVKERKFTKSSADRVQRFAHLLQENGVETTIRRRLGSDIDAACGQLRRRYMQK